jgi:hypothetical protein
MIATRRPTRDIDFLTQGQDNGSVMPRNELFQA